MEVNIDVIISTLILLVQNGLLPLEPHLTIAKREECFVNIWICHEYQPVDKLLYWFVDNAQLLNDKPVCLKLLHQSSECICFEFSSVLLTSTRSRILAFGKVYYFTPFTTEELVHTSSSLQQCPLSPSGNHFLCRGKPWRL